MSAPSPEPVPSGFDVLSDPAAVKAISHPTRSLIFRMAAHRPVSAKEVAQFLEQPVDRVSYHVRTLAEAGLLEAVRRTRVRGATETHYQAVATMDLTDEVLDQVPEYRTAVYKTLLQQINDDLMHALDSGAAADPGFLAARGHITVTDAGRERLVDELRGMYRRLVELEAELGREGEQEAGNGAPTHEMNVVLGVYEGGFAAGRNGPLVVTRAWPDEGDPPLIGRARVPE